MIFFTMGNQNQTGLPWWLDDNYTDTWALFDVPSGGQEAWGIVLCVAILIVNLSVMGVIGSSRDLWKPRHLWMACLCFSDLFVAAHKGLDVALMWRPSRFLCTLQRSTLGIPYVANMMVLTLLSLDRFVAVRFPFFYSRSVGKRHVALAYGVVLLTSASLAVTSVVLALRGSECRAQPLQLIYLTSALILCSCLSLFFNGSVLRIAKRQLNAIYAQEEALGKRRVSIVCSKCGFKNETFMNALLPMAAAASATTTITTSLNTSRSRRTSSVRVIPSSKTRLFQSSLEKVAGDLEKRLEDALVDLTAKQPDIKVQEDIESAHIEMRRVDNTAHNVTPDLLDLPLHDVTSSVRHKDEALQPLVRTTSLPNMAGQTVADLPPPDVTSNGVAEPPPESAGDSLLKAPSLPDLPGNGTLAVVTMSNGTTQQCVPGNLQRRHSFTCRPGCKFRRNQRLHMFRHLHFTASHLFHVRRLSPSIRFARTVLFILIPTWIFILPIITIIPMHQDCVDGVTRSGIDCSLVECLWAYLLVHMRNVLPFQAILDTLIYACSSKEFKEAFHRRLKSCFN